MAAGPTGGTRTSSVYLKYRGEALDAHKLGGGFVIRTRLVLLSEFLLVFLNSLCRASDQVAEVRLYAIDCGRMDFKDMGALFSDTGEYAGQAGTFVDPVFS